MILPLADLEPIGPFAEPRPSMRGRYRMSNPLKVLAITGLDALLRLMPVRRAEVASPLQRILVANWAHLGDVVTTMGALRALRRRYPDARIGMIVGSWGKAAIADTGLIDDIHVIDHWALNRSGASRWDKYRRYRETRKRALRDIKSLAYQAAIDFFPLFPPAHPLFRQAGIPTRIGYVSGGFGPLLTHALRWKNCPRPMADHYRPLLDALVPAQPFTKADLQPSRDRGSLVPLSAELKAFGPYIVVHPGAGSPSRIWGKDRWRRFLEIIGPRLVGHTIILTGAGASDVALCTHLEDAVPGIVNQAGRADWETFVGIVAHARLVVCPDTATGHVAALFDVPTVSIFTGTNDPQTWAPYSREVAVLTRPVVCAPCNSPGCDAMACFLGVTPDDVAQAALKMLAANSSEITIPVAEPD